MSTNKTPGQETHQKLKALENLARTTTERLRRESRDRNPNIRGFLPELDKLRKHLKAFQNPEATRKLAAVLKTDNTVIRSQQTRGYLAVAHDVVTGLMRTERNAAELLFALGWLRRLLLVGDAVGQGNRRGQPGRKQKRNSRR